MTSRFLRFSLLAAALLASGTATAQTSDADRVKARALANQGYDALDRKDYPIAAERFERADHLFHVATVALGLARAQVGLGRLLQAQETYRRMVREGAARGAPAPIVKAVAEARRELEDLSPRIPGVIVNVTGPDAPRVSIDGIAVASAAQGERVRVNPGKHAIEAAGAGYQSREVSVTVAEAKTLTVPIELRRDLPAPTPDLPPPSWPAQKIAGATLMGVSAIGFVVGGVFAGQAHSKFADLSSKCPTRTGCDPSLGPELDAYHSVSNASLAAFVVGGVVLGTGFVVYLTAPKVAAPAAAFVAPRVGVGYLGVEGGF